MKSNRIILIIVIVQALAGIVMFIVLYNLIITNRFDAASAIQKYASQFKPISLQGPKGDQGDEGPRGFQGENGPQGTPGPQGNQGNNGQDGSPGTSIKGDKGDTGDQGPAGVDGRQIELRCNPDTSTWEMRYTGDEDWQSLHAVCRPKEAQ